MRVSVYLVGVFVALLTGFALASITDSLLVGFVAAAVIFSITIYLAWERNTRGDEAGYLGDGEEGRVHARNAGAYSQAGHGGGYFGGDGGGGGCDGGGGGSC